MSVKAPRAFADGRFDYYELQQDLANIVPKGAIFVHDTEDDVYGSIADGCLKLCWTPNGNIYSTESHGICGGTIVLHSVFKDSEMFKLARASDPRPIIQSLRELSYDVNPNEIADHIKFESLENWCTAWREQFEREIKRLEECNP